MSAMPASFGRYTVTGEIGAGAMGRVYSGFDPLVQRAVAIKTLRRELLLPQEAGDALRRFQREAQAAGRLSHPHIVNVFDVGEDYIVMELLDGASLQVLLRERGALGFDDTVALLRPVALALDHAHLAGVIHRDIKPGNIMVLPDGRPKLMDFGLARLESAVATRPGEVFGSPSYMAPEQIAGHEISPRADIYALAVVAYECLTGRKPFEGASVTGIINQIMHEAPPAPRCLVSELPERCDAVFERALAKDPSLRYASAAELLDELEDRPRPAAERTLSGPWPTSRSPDGATRGSPESPAGVTHTYDDLQEPLAQITRADAGTSSPRAGVGLRAPAPGARRDRWVVVALGLLLLLFLAVPFVARRPLGPPVESPAPAPTSSPRLRVLTEPAGAGVFLDGRAAGQAPVELGPLTPGRHTVRVTRAGFAPAQLSVEVTAGRELAPLSFVLQPLTAALNVSSQPAGAQVHLGSQLVGTTPIERLPLPPGVYDLRVEHPGYASWRHTVSAAAGETQSVRAVLNAGGRARVARIRAGDLVPAGAPGVSEPVRISGEAPPYPAVARVARMQGSVLVALIVDEHGLPTQVHVVESAGEVLDRAVLEAVRSWRFEPARKDGVPVKYPLLRRQTFQLD